MAEHKSLNAQGLSRNIEPLMRSMVADPGMVMFASDLAAAEPGVTSQLSKDRNYYDASFGMIGKRPHYDGKVLKIDDLYLTVMSVSPIGADDMRKAFDELRVADTWGADAEGIKRALKGPRNIHKVLALALAYGLGPKGVVRTAKVKGYDLDPRVAKAFYESYWDLFSGVRDLGKRLEREFRRKGYLVNPFGYRLVPEADYKCLNAVIQSTVSGIMSALCAKFFAACPWAQYGIVLHDELIGQIPQGREDEARKLLEACALDLTEDLGWEIPIRVGWNTGRDLYSIK